MSPYQSSISEGMVVRSLDGEKLGTVTRLESELFFIEKGIFFREEFAVRYDDVDEVRDGEIFLQHQASKLRDLSAQSDLRATTSTQQGTILGNRSGLDFRGERKISQDRPVTTNTPDTPRDKELRVPVIEEELEVERHARDAGAVRVRKEVSTEEKQITVPVQHEEVVVERVAVPPGTSAAGIDDTLDEDIVVPVKDEEVEIHKRPVVKEEVRIRKETRQEQEAASATVRRQDVKVDDQIQKTRKGVTVKQDPPTKNPRGR